MGPAALRASRRISLFLGAFLLLTLTEFRFRQELGPLVNGLLTVRAGASLLALIVPQAGVHARGDWIESDQASIHVAQGCEGVDVMLMFAAATLALPLSWRRRAVVGLFGVLAIYLLNLVRVAGLWLCLRYWPTAFEAMHVTVGQTVMIILALSLLLGAARFNLKEA